MSLVSISKPFKTLASRLLAAYSLWRLKPLPEESRTYNTTDRILLTFDDYGDPQVVRQFLDTLEQHNVLAAFFLVGTWTSSHPKLVDEIKRAGHWVGNHTYDHEQLDKLPDEAMRKAITGGPTATILRPPYGAYNPRIRAVAKDLGYKISFWTVDSDDWQGISAHDIQQRVWKKLHPGACVLLHLNAPHTLEALPKLIEGIRKRGYQLCHDGKELVW